jgi:hypothetical protein
MTAPRLLEGRGGGGGRGLDRRARPVRAVEGIGKEDERGWGKTGIAVCVAVPRGQQRGWDGDGGGFCCYATPMNVVVNKNKSNCLFLLITPINGSFVE